MMRYIFIIIFLSLLIHSCGKKSDPVYEQKKSKISSIKISNVV